MDHSLWQVREHPVGSFFASELLLSCCLFPFHSGKCHQEAAIEQLLRETIATYEEDLFAFTTALVAILHRKSARSCLSSLCQTHYREADTDGLASTLLEVPSPASSASASEPGYCILSSYGTGEPTLYFHGH